MHFVATDSMAENVARVVQRAQAGGHGASEREIRAIHHASVANLRKAIASFSHAAACVDPRSSSWRAAARPIQRPRTRNKRVVTNVRPPSTVGRTSRCP
jgi:predicted ABC-type ATPase